MLASEEPLVRSGKNALEKIPRVWLDNCLARTKESMEEVIKDRILWISFSSQNLCGMHWRHKGLSIIL